MQLISILLPFTLFAAVLAQGSAGFLITAMTNIWEKVQDLNTAIEGLSATSLAADFAKLDTLSATIAATIDEGVKAVNAGKEVSLMDAIKIQSAASNLSVATANSVDGLIEKKELLIKNNQKDAVLKQFNTLLKKTKDFNAAVSSKLPAMVKSIAETQSAQPLAALDRGIKAFT
jgi:hypothetical protein